MTAAAAANSNCTISSESEIIHDVGVQFQRSRDFLDCGLRGKLAPLGCLIRVDIERGNLRRYLRKHTCIKRIRSMNTSSSGYDFGTFTEHLCS